MKKTEFGVKMSMKQRVGAAAITAVIALGMTGGATMAFADNGLQSGSQTYDSKTTNWTGAGAGETGQGEIDLLYSTVGGKWQDPGADPSTPGDNTEHDNGTYTVTIPTKIAYENMAIGTVSTSDDYTVNVKGALPTGQKVTLNAETGKPLSTGSDGGITETTTQGKTTWTADEAFGTLNTDGSLSGTNATDNIKLSGTAKSAGEYTGTVAYTSTLG